MAAVTNILYLLNGRPTGIGSGDTITAPGTWTFTDSGTALAVTGGATVGGDLSVAGNLDVSGDIVAHGTVNLTIKDPIIDLGLGNSSANAGTVQAGGFTVQMAAASGVTAATVKRFVTSTQFEINDTGATPLVANQIIAITGLPAAFSENEGLYAVDSVLGSNPQVVNIKATGYTGQSSTPFLQTAFQNTTTTQIDAGFAFQTRLSALVLASGVTGAFPDSSGTAYPAGTAIQKYTAAAVLSDFTGSASWTPVGNSTVSLQNAYNNGNTITTSSSGLLFTLANGGNFNIEGPGFFSAGATTPLVDVQIVSDFLMRLYTNTLEIQNNTGGNFVAYIGTMGAATQLINIGSSGADSYVELTGDGAQISVGANAYPNIVFNTTTSVEIKNGKELRFYEPSGSGSNYTAFKAQAQSGDVTYTLPAADGSASQYLQTNGSGTLSWSTVAADTLQTVYNASSDPATLQTAAGKELVFSLDATGPFQVQGPGAVEFGTGGLTDLASFSVVTSGATTVDAAGAISLDSTGTASNFTLTANDAGTATLAIAASNSGAGTGVIDMDADGAFTLDAASLSLDATSASNLSVTGGDLALSTITSGNVNIDGADAVSIGASAASDFTVATGDLSLTATLASVNVTGGEAATDAVKIEASDAAGGVLVQSGSAGIDVDGDTGAVLVQSNKAAAAAIKLYADNTNASTTIEINSAGTGASALNIDSAGGIELDAVSGISLGAGAASDFTVTGTLDIDATGAVSINSSGAAINVGNDAVNQAINVGTQGARTISVGSTAATAAGVEAATISIGSQNLAHTVNLGNGGGGFDQIVNIGSSAGASDVNINAGSAGVSIDGAGASNFSVTGADLTLSTITSGDVKLTVAGAQHGVMVDSLGGVGIVCVNKSLNNLQQGTIVALKANANPASNSVPEVVEADANATEVTERRFFGVVVTSGGVAPDGSMKVATFAGALTRVTFTSAPAATNVGDPVFISQTAGEAILDTSGFASGSAVVQIGYLAWANIGNVSGNIVVLAPQFIAQIP